MESTAGRSEVIKEIHLHRRPRPGMNTLELLDDSNIGRSMLSATRTCVVERARYDLFLVFNFLMYLGFSFLGYVESVLD